MKITDDITWRLLRHFNPGDIVLPNFYLKGHECDVIRITRSKQVYEYEVKVSRADFKKDFAKTNPLWSSDGASMKHDKLALGKRVNRFFFVVPDGMVSIDEVPAHAGLIYFTKSKQLMVVKPAPILTKDAIEVKGLEYSCYHREMNLRAKMRAKTDDLMTIDSLRKRISALENLKAAYDVRKQILQDPSSRFVKHWKANPVIKQYFPELLHNYATVLPARLIHFIPDPTARRAEMQAWVAYMVESGGKINAPQDGWLTCDLNGELYAIAVEARAEETLRAAQEKLEAEQKLLPENLEIIPEPADICLS